jgi:hypothetical protein
MIMVAEACGGGCSLRAWWIGKREREGERENASDTRLSPSPPFTLSESPALEWCHPRSGVFLP